MGTIGASATVKKSSAQVSTLVEGETIVLQLETGTYFSLNEVGVVVWEALDQPRTVDELKDKVLAEYDVEEALCFADICTLLEELLKEEIIELVQVNPGSANSV